MPMAKGLFSRFSCSLHTKDNGIRTFYTIRGIYPLRKWPLESDLLDTVSTWGHFGTFNS